MLTIWLCDNEVIGLFAASSAAVLAAPADEHCDPMLCEFAIAADGGLIVPAVTKAKWPMKVRRSSVSTGLQDTVLTQQWEDDLDAGTTLLEWRSLKPAVKRMLRKLGKAH